MTGIKRIGLLTSGGDCAGLNAVISAVLRRADSLGWEVYGIRQGTQGLIDRPVRAERLVASKMTQELLRRGGTILGTTNKGNPFDYLLPDGSRVDLSSQIIEGWKLLGLDALIGIGGDGSLAILKTLAEKGGIPLVGIPKTIDNDLGQTDLAVGFDTAVMVATEALDRLQPTAASHDRVMVLEVMGRDAGHIALAAGVAGGADVILIPEIPWSMDCICKKIKDVHHAGRNFALVVVSEAVKAPGGGKLEISYPNGEKRLGGIGDLVGHLIAKQTGAETRVTVLGHVQRGSQPTHQDRIIAQAFGVRAVELIAEGKYDRMVAWSQRQVIDVAIADAIARYQEVRSDDPILKTARGLGICLGD